CSVSVGGQTSGCSRNGRERSLRDARMTVVSPTCCDSGVAFAWAEAFENAPKPSRAQKTPAKARTKPRRTRRFKKADCEVDFFFMRGACRIFYAVAILRWNLRKNQYFFVETAFFRMNDFWISSLTVARHSRGFPDRSGASVSPAVVPR